MSAGASLIAFVGTTPNIGTTVSAFAAAYRIAEMSRGRVGFLCLNLKSAKIHRFLGVDRPTVTLDDLRPELHTATLEPAKLSQAMVQIRSGVPLYVLFGNTLRDQAEFYQPDEIEHLLETAMRLYDVVIADVGAYWDNAATVCALRQADLRILATTPALSHFQEDAQRWMKQLSPLFEIPSSYEALIIGQPGRSRGYPAKDICKEMGVPYMGEIKLTESMLSQLDSGTIDEWLAHDEEGQQAMSETARAIVQRRSLAIRPVMAVQPWYKRLVAHRGGKSS
ncbi:pilus assembly protein CpaE [Paenibacillus phyllosphaerae]|uniref:Pilus assembly protein CpaE n=1 Tax=Paenibacillus phyllosphaerae TaxID=274593 RepID=A0A7W5FPL1_9BACL|nr:hypothetical protein [Paenibacillus phyllosphaerae]MBB3112154.1 pilus assembly protein CpaE [Paenibacillus phyllosphaerae]